MKVTVLDFYGFILMPQTQSREKQSLPTATSLQVTLQAVLQKAPAPDSCLHQMGICLESDHHFGWKKSLRSSPAMNIALPSHC